MAANALAQAPTNVTAQEWAVLPRYCPYTLMGGKGGNKWAPTSDGQKWVALLGDTFWDLHHYCWGLTNLLRGQRDVVGDFQYVIRHSRNDFLLLPEIYTRLGQVELRLSHYEEASKAFAQARALKPDYWPPYFHWAEFLIRAGKGAEAKQLVKSGLEYSPDAKTLQEQYRRLGGKPSEIVPIVRKDAPLPEEEVVENTERLLTEDPDPAQTAKATPAGKENR